MTVALRATASSGGAASVTTMSIVVPSSAVANDIALLSVQTNGSTITCSTPTGWTLVYGPDTTSTATACYLFYKVLASGDAGATVSATISTSSRVMAMMDVISGGTITGAIFGHFVDSASNTSTTVPTLSSVPAGAYMSVHIPRRISSGTSGPTITVPSGYTDDSDYVATANGTGSNFSSQTCHKVVSAAGSYGGESVTVSTSVGTVYAIAIPDGSPQLTGSGTLASGAGIPAPAASGALSGSGTVAGTQTAATAAGPGALTGLGSLSTPSSATFTGTATLTGAGALGTVVLTAEGGSSGLSGSGTLASLTTGRTGKAKVWNGSAWVAHPAKVWNGSAWVAHPIKGQASGSWVVAK